MSRTQLQALLAAFDVLAQQTDQLFVTEDAFDYDLLGGPVQPEEKSAMAVMAWMHVHQRRKGPKNRPYSVHPLMVWLTVRCVTTDIHQRVAALLHDTMEDAEKSWPGMRRHHVRLAIKERFAPESAELVSLLSNPENLEPEDKDTWQTNQFEDYPQIQVIKSADKLVNGFDTILDSPNWSAEKLAKAIDKALQIVRTNPNAPALYAELADVLESRAIRAGILVK